MAHTLQFTDGTTTVNFIGNDNYSLSSWAPTVPARRFGEIGGRGPYQEVVDEMSIVIAGTTPAETLQKLIDLQNLFYQAVRWKNKEIVNPVLLKYKPHDSSPSVLTATVIGPANDDEPMVVLPENFPITPMIKVIDNVVLRFKRTVLLAADETASSTSVNNPEKMTATFSSSAISSPLEMRVNYSNFGSSISFDVGSAIVLMTNDGNKLIVGDSKEMADLGMYTSISASGTRSGSILRYTPTDLNYNVTAEYSGLSAIATSVRKLAVFFSFRSTASAPTWTVKARAVSRNLALPDTPPLAIPGASIIQPSWYFLGIVSSPFQLNAVKLVAKTSTSVGSPSLDSDTFALLGVDDEMSRAVWFTNTSFNLATNSIWNMRFKHNTLASPSPSLELWRGTTQEEYAPAYTGDPYLLTSGSVVTAAYLATEGGSWCALTGNGSSRLQTSLSAIRNKAYLVPQ